MARIEPLRARSGRAREVLAAVPALIDRYRKATLAAAFRGDLTADWREEHSGESAAPVIFELCCLGVERHQPLEDVIVHRQQNQRAAHGVRANDVGMLEHVMQ